MRTIIMLVAYAYFIQTKVNLDDAAKVAWLLGIGFGIAIVGDVSDTILKLKKK